MRQHWEIRVGQIVYYIYAPPGSHVIQEIPFRRVDDENPPTVFGRENVKLSTRKMCITTGSDDEITDFLSRTWIGPYNVFERDCQVFSLSWSASCVERANNCIPGFIGISLDTFGDWENTLDIHKISQSGNVRWERA